MPFDVITFGEAMIRLTPPNFRRLEQARSLDLQVGGAELNTAVGLARLGRKAAWVSRLTDNPLGRLIANQRPRGRRQHRPRRLDQGRPRRRVLPGVRRRPARSSVLYDRKGAAIANVKPGMVDWAKVFAGAKWFHVTGITPALSPTAAEATREALKAATRRRRQDQHRPQLSRQAVDARRGRQVHERVHAAHRRAHHTEEDIEQGLRHQGQGLRGGRRADGRSSSR